MIRFELLADYFQTKLVAFDYIACFSLAALSNEKIKTLLPFSPFLILVSYYYTVHFVTWEQPYHSSIRKAVGACLAASSRSRCDSWSPKIMPKWPSGVLGTSRRESPTFNRDPIDYSSLAYRRVLTIFPFRHFPHRKHRWVSSREYTAGNVQEIDRIRQGETTIVSICRHFQYGWIRGTTKGAESHIATLSIARSSESLLSEF